MVSPRPLAYRDRFVWLLEQVVSSLWDDCDDFADRFVFPDMDSRIPLVIELSQREWTTLYSAVMTGADLTYPDTAHDVEYLLLQTVMCPVTQFCAAMINCLQNDPDTLAALLQLLSDNGYTGGVGDPNAPLSDEILDANLLPAGYTCTDDKAFGMALAVVNSINDATTEVLQAIEILTNPVEIAAELGDNVPGVGALASAGDIARWIQDAATEAYELAWSPTIRDELACLLWCEFKGGCHLSYDSIWNVYLGASGASPPSGVLLTDWLAWLIALPFTASLSTVATVSLLGLLAMRYGGSFGDFELGIRSLETVINLAQDDSSSDWSTVCSGCGAWCYRFDFRVDDGGWIAAANPETGLPLGVWVDGIGWTAEVVTGDDEAVWIYKSFSTAHFTQARMIYTIQAGAAQGFASIRDADPLTTLIMETGQGPGSNLMVWTGSRAMNSLWLQAGSNQNVATPTNIEQITFYGTGSCPFGTPNC